MCISGKTGGKPFCSRICHTKLLQHRNMAIKALRTHGKTSSHVKKVKANKSQSSLLKSFEALASNKVFHHETFIISSYQVKEGEMLLAVHSILAYTPQRTIEKYVEMTKVLSPDSKIPEQLELERTKLGYLLQFGLAPC